MLSKILYPFQLLWRLWFFVAVFLAIVVVFPFITLFSLRKKWYPLFFVFARVWAYLVLILSGFIPVVKNRKLIDRKKTYIIVANHTSMLDIMMTYVTIPNVFMFIGKKELERLPIFGYFYKRTNILVDRKSLASRRDVFFEARSRLRENLGLCIYPEGGVPTDSNIDLWPFKIGAFRLAVEEGVDILPITFPDTKRHQPYHITQGGYPGRVRAIIHPPISVVGKNEKDLRDETRDLILKTLLG